jgi:hypothetical protein
MVNASHAEKASTPQSLPMGERKVNGITSVNQSGDHTPASSIPPSVEKDLQSPEARDRYRALDYWETKDSKAPLDAVFEAMEDEDEAVRDKATAIVEQHWAAAEEKERS